MVYLGHIVGGGELKIDPSKVEAIVNWPTPKSVTEVRSFLGASLYWRKFIANFFAIAAPMHAVTSVKKGFHEYFCSMVSLSLFILKHSMVL